MSITRGKDARFSKIERSLMFGRCHPKECLGMFQFATLCTTRRPPAGLSARGGTARPIGGATWVPTASTTTIASWTTPSATCRCSASASATTSPTPPGTPASQVRNVLTTPSQCFKNSALCAPPFVAGPSGATAEARHRVLKITSLEPHFTLN